MPERDKKIRPLVVNSILNHLLSFRIGPIPSFRLFCGVVGSDGSPYLPELQASDSILVFPEYRDTSSELRSPKSAF